MRNVVLFAAIAAVTLPSVSAQNLIVSPAAMTNTGTSQWNSIPWGPYASTIGEGFMHQIYDDLRGAPRVLKGFAFRHWWSQAYVSKTYTVKITLAEAATPASGISTTYASNFKTGGSQTVVFNASVTFPAMPALTRSPSPFAARVLFTTPHVDLGVDSLLAEVFVINSTPIAPVHYFERGPQLPHVAGVVGKGCTPTGGASPMDASGTCTAAAFTDSLLNGPATAATVLLFGDTSALLGGSLPLPVDLVLIGSPGCWVNINPLLTLLTTTTSAAGSASSSVPYTLTPALTGFRFRTQWVSIDGAFVRTSNGLDHATAFGAPGSLWPQWRVYSAGFGATPPAVGSTLGNQGLVTEWSY